MGYVAEHARRFFHPAAIEEVLSAFVPLIDGTRLDVSCLRGSTGLFSYISSEPSCTTILSPDILATLAPSILSANAVSDVGVNKLLHVR